MWTVSFLRYVTLGFLIPLLLLCSCDGRIGPFGAVQPALDTNSEVDSSTATGADESTDNESDSASELEGDTGSDTSLDTGLDTAHGLAGQYFSRYNLSEYVGCQRDPEIDFLWTDVPMAGLDSLEGISVRWTGWVTPDHDGTYTFSTLSDDGVRLRVKAAV